MNKVWRHPGLSQVGGDEDATGTQWMKGRDAVKLPTVHRKVPPPKESSAPVSEVLLRNPEFC